MQDNLCYKHVGVFNVDQAASVCAQLDAKLPLPRNSAELQDFETIRLSYRTGSLFGFVALDGSDVAQEGVWRDSSGRKGVKKLFFGLLFIFISHLSHLIIDSQTA